MRHDPNSAKKSAFNFIELSIIILILTILIAGIFTASNIISKSRKATAQNLTKNSPINSVEDVLAWYETTSDNSFLSNERQEDALLSRWNDIKIGMTTLNATQSDDNYKPNLEGKINGLTTVKFQGTGQHFIIDATNINNRDYTIFIVEKRNSGNGNNYFIGDRSLTDENETILLGYSASGAIIHSQGGDNNYSSNVSSFAESSNDVRIFSFMQSSTLGKKTYINGYLAGQDLDTQQVSNLSDLVIGKEYDGELAEVIIYNKALSNVDRGAVESYLSQKWNVRITHQSVSCTNGIVNSDGCEIACGVNVNGVATPTSVAGGSSGDLNCNATGYDDTDYVSYTCSSNSIFTIDSGACDTCTTGYAYYSGTCQTGCNTGSTPGIITTDVNAGAGSLTCDDSANHFSGSITYVCDDGEFTLDSGQVCGCASGYELNGEGTTCIPNCSVEVTGVATPTTVSSNTSGSLYCNDTGYDNSDSVHYTCSAEAVFSIDSGICDSCTSGYSYYNGSCQAGCNSGTIVGITSASDVSAGTGSLTCNDSSNHFEGSVTYTCNNGEFALNSGQACGCASGYVLNEAGTACVPSCDVNVVGVETPTTVASNTSGSITCNAYGYDDSDSVNYTCSAEGVFTIDSGACDACISGYTYYNGSCQGSCNTGVIRGITNPFDVAAGTGSLTCDDTANHFDNTSTISYVCDGGEFTLDSGQECSCEEGYVLNSSGVCVASCEGGDNIYTATVSGTEYVIHEFKTVGLNFTFKCPSIRKVDLLIVGGGGSGGNYGGLSGGGGGGSGSYREIANYNMPALSVPVVVGGGATSGSLGRGEPSKFGASNIYYTPGGSPGGAQGQNGGSASYESGGGGGGGHPSNGGGGGSYGTTRAGGNGQSGGCQRGGGGGGALSRGMNGNEANIYGPGNGGPGRSSSITGGTLEYGGGGAGGSGCAASSATHGGGKLGEAGAPNTGGGGGGGYNGSPPGAGGSGLVIVRYKLL